MWKLQHFEKKIGIHEVDEEIDREILCEAVGNLEINSQFLDEELICPDQRTDRFNIYATRVGPEDLEDCD